MLFDNVEAEEYTHSYLGDYPDYDYLSKYQGYSKLRATLNEWFIRYSATVMRQEWVSNEDKVGQVASIETKFRSEGRSKHTSAFFELYIHELLIKLGYEIAAVEPNAENINSKPDFLVRSVDRNEEFYVEATLATDEPHHDKKRPFIRITEEEQIKASKVRNFVDEMTSPNFEIHMHIRMFSLSDVPPSELISILKREIDRYNEKEVRTRAKEGIQYPTYVYTRHGWDIEFTFEPRPKSDIMIPVYIEGRGIVPKPASEFGIDLFANQQPSGSLGSYSPDLKNLWPSKAIREKLRKKAKGNSRIDKPYIVAINALGYEVSKGDFCEALYGTIKHNDGGVYYIEELSGPWGINTEHHCVSAVLGVMDVHPHNVLESNPSLFYNPHNSWVIKATMPIFPYITEVELKGKEVSIRYGQNIKDILQLNSGWPNY